MVSHMYHDPPVDMTNVSEVLSTCSMHQLSLLYTNHSWLLSGTLHQVSKLLA